MATAHSAVMSGSLYVLTSTRAFSRSASPTSPSGDAARNLLLERDPAIVAVAASEIGLDLVGEVVEQRAPAAERRLAVEHHALEFLLVLRASCLVHPQLRLTFVRVHLLPAQP